MPPADACQPAKALIMAVCMADAWGELAGVERWDADGDGDLTSEEVSITGIFGLRLLVLR